MKRSLSSGSATAFAGLVAATGMLAWTGLWLRAAGDERWIDCAVGCYLLMVVVTIALVRALRRLGDEP